ncbi:methionyl-tRNA formyltransferase [Treponema sp. HNW]|uniref:methionyl-tRNA formyltransferase n=1 Tax=Treponema sp. HNW TaxID=3116654 RepID=UPI003D0A4DF2
MLKIVYAGSPDISAVLLKGLIDLNRVHIAAVLTNAPAPAGRSKTPLPTPVAALAYEKGLEVLEPEKLDASVRQRIAELKPDLLVCFAYGKIFGPKFLALFPKGGINLHPSLLPKYRGCAPVPAAILAGETKTGISVQRLALEMDCGDILAQKEIPLTGTETAAEVLSNAAVLAIPLVAEVIGQIEENREKAVVQDSSKACYCKSLVKTDALIDWTRSAEQICAQVRALQPWPGTYTCANGSKLYIHSASVYTGNLESAGGKQRVVFCTDDKPRMPGRVIGTDKDCGILIQTGDGVLAVQVLQRETKKAVHWKDFFNGCRNFGGTLCTNEPV